MYLNKVFLHPSAKTRYAYMYYAYPSLKANACCMSLCTFHDTNTCLFSFSLKLEQANSI